MATIQSATGPIDSDDLGFTLMHEHVYVGWAAMLHEYPERFDFDEILAQAVERLRQASEAGVRTIVDCTPIGLGREAGLIRDAAKQSGIQIIAPTGLYYQVPFYFSSRPTQVITEVLVSDIVDGIGDSGVRAGVIKCATEPEMDRMNERVLRGSARAHRETGVPIVTHTYPANRTGLDQQSVFKDEGADLGRIVIGHSDDSDDISYLEEIIDNGSYCGMDRIGIENPRTNEQRADMVAALVEKGYAERITLSHDASGWFDFSASQDRMTEVMPNWRWTYIPTDFSAMLLDRGISDADIEQMMAGNPRAIFGQTESY
ncbi:MAG TPA: phosphotriesterase-related protein [Dehalococcoidia bacterium]|nr:phosphotriesterase-related protein [Dehalococcoidia bacterium]